MAADQAHPVRMPYPLLIETVNLHLARSSRIRSSLSLSSPSKFIVQKVSVSSPQLSIGRWRPAFGDLISLCQSCQPEMFLRFAHYAKESGRAPPNYEIMDTIHLTDVGKNEENGLAADPFHANFLVRLDGPMTCLVAAGRFGIHLEPPDSFPHSFRYSGSAVSVEIRARAMSLPREKR